jgi:para-nitrobenzyl esterase
MFNSRSILRSIVCVAVIAAGLTACGDDDDSAGKNGSDNNKDGSAGSDAANTGPADDGGSADAASGDAGEVNAELVVAIEPGKVQGDYSGESRRFLKIPYAKPPVGDLRWKAPMKPEPWDGVRHETEFPGACAQNKSAGSPASDNEDCLYLNVWTPKKAPTKAPVMFWIHGGGNFAGSTFDHVPTSMDQLWFDGRFFAERHGIVVVTTNYRLGPMGFFAHPALADEGSPSGNQGLLDQNMALQWVQDNIAKFGGDPDNVTIFGESAGSADVCYHVASPTSRGLFHRAISQSGGCTSGLGGIMRERTVADVKKGMQAFTKAMGCDKADDALGCLRGKSASDILANGMQPDPMAGADAPAPEWSFSVVIDGEGGFLPKSARSYFDDGDIAKVPYILGSNNDEGRLFTYLTTAPKNDMEYMEELTTRFGADAAEKIYAVYPPSKFDDNYADAIARVVGDSGLVCGTHDSARRAVAAGLHVFMYNFNVPWAISADLLKATHASEISSVFGDPYDPDDESQTVSDAMNAYWAQFAKTGDPNYDDAPATWPAFEPDAGDHDARLQFDKGFEIVDDFRREECAMWRELYEAP